MAEDVKGTQEHGSPELGQAEVSLGEPRQQSEEGERYKDPMTQR